MNVSLPIAVLLPLLVAGCGRGEGSSSAGSNEHAGHAEPPGAGPDGEADHTAHGGLPSGHAEVRISADQQQRVGLQLAVVERGELGGRVRATAVVQADEKREAHVHSRLMGYVRKLHVNTVGQRVKKGQPLYAVYSQELLVAQQEYLRARTLSPDLAQATRERLRLWDIPDDQIAALEARGAPLEEVTVRSPLAGTVIEKNIVQGHFVEPDMMLYRIADLSRVWVVADVYEYELSRVDRRASATVRIEGFEQELTAPIDYVYPTVDPASRTVKVRLVVDNRAGQLRPGNFATVELPTTGGGALTIPEDAVIDTGIRRIVYVEAADERFRPVEVEVGRRASGRVEVRSGLAAGDRVVIAAQFLVDSESRLRASGQAPGHGGH
jgi:Cu(I)/Ag(I) efflux system membrane fusion protein